MFILWSRFFFPFYVLFFSTLCLVWMSCFAIVLTELWMRNWICILQIFLWMLVVWINECLFRGIWCSRVLYNFTRKMNTLWETLHFFIIFFWWDFLQMIVLWFVMRFLSSCWLLLLLLLVRSCLDLVVIDAKVLPKI